MADIKANARLSMPKPVMHALMSSRVHSSYMELMEDEDDPAQLQQLISNIKEDVNARIDTLVKSGILQEKDNLLTTQLDYQAGKVQANGKDLNEEGMMGLMQALP